MIYTYVILSFFWIGYCFLHSFFADNRIKNSIQLRTGVSDRWYRLGYNIFAFVSLVLLVFFQASIHSSLIFEQSVGVKILAGLFLVPGLSIMLICIYKYFKQLSGLKKMEPVLVTTGLHHYVRHPLYLGTFIFLAGIVLAFPLISNLIAFIIIVVYTLWGIGSEEKKLVQQFGKDYIHYQQTVPMIIPFIFRKF